MTEQKQEFHVGDMVFAMLTGKYEPFAIKQVTRSADGTLLYSGESTPWYPQDRLDYELEPELAGYMHGVERRIHEYALALKDVQGMDNEEQFKRLPLSIQQRLLAKMGLAALP